MFGRRGRLEILVACARQTRPAAATAPPAFDPNAEPFGPMSNGTPLVPWIGEHV
jgi:hypothetical protein